jgi:hypothetical protein
VGGAANDCHYNSGARLKLSAKGDLLVEDYRGRQVARCRPEALNIRVPEDAKPGDTLASIPVDTYERSFKCVTTHILAADLDEKSILDAVKAGRCYVCFDWLGDPAGFVFMCRVKDRQLLPGNSAGLADAPKILAESPLPAEYHLYRNGTKVLTADGRGFEYEVLAPGNYRLEVFLNVADEKLPWIFTNQLRIGD